jgi:hypothetical protein
LGKAIKKYRAIFVGLLSDAEDFKKNMARLGISSSALDKYIKNAPAVLKKNLTLPDARKYAEVIINAGGLVNIQETGKFSKVEPFNTKKNIPDHNLTVCPNCGFKQTKTNYCIRCGIELSHPH